MRKTRILLIAISVLVVTAIYLLPKVVVEDDSQLGTGAVAADSLTHLGAAHGTTSKEKAAAIKELRARYLSGPPTEKSAIFADSLASLYKSAGKFDSAAWFAEEAATFFGSAESFLKTADNYYEAYLFAIDPTKQKAMAGKAQAFYGKVLEQQPTNLDVKTKMAMTLLATAPPMQAIAKLREILDEHPEHELALYNLGMLSIQSGQYALAVERLEKLTSVNPQHVQGQLLLGVAYANTDQKAKARQQFEKVKKLDSDPAVQATADSYLKDLQ
ncbi:MAG: tetratricopeptide repeat protein [Cyclobacteriaceae bacterium]|jgi:tetratricopeptide (TPR) repeat protein|nr:tetratricopeptide repeat protein [Cyclobacteriaceae bacterium]